MEYWPGGGNLFVLVHLFDRIPWHHPAEKGGATSGRHLQCMALERLCRCLVLAKKQMSDRKNAEPEDQTVNSANAGFSNPDPARKHEARCTAVAYAHPASSSV